MTLPAVLISIHYLCFVPQIRKINPFAPKIVYFTVGRALDSMMAPP